MAPKDTSSVDVQIGQITYKIKEVEIEIKEVSYDCPMFLKMRRILISNIGKRRHLLDYLRTTDTKRYKKVLSLIKRDMQE